ncbi:MAG: OmpA family protein [Syntrophales bacterium]|nr:OmpA family protein [Syntrophales bacterium]
MRIVTKILIFCLITVFAITIETTNAQVQPGQFSVGAYAGYITFDNERKLHDSPLGGIRLGYDFTRYFGLEGTFGLFNTAYDTPVKGKKEVKGVTYRLEGLLHLLPRSPIVPFLAVGGGGMNLDYPQGVSNSHRPIVDYGAGLKLFGGENWLMRLDVRHLYEFDTSRSDVEFTMGLSYLFGRKKEGLVYRTEETVMEETISAPLNLKVWPKSESENNLSWDPVTAAKAYRIYRDGKYLTQSETNQALDVGLSPATRYCYRVTALSATGKESATSNEACATTPAKRIAAPTEVTAKAVSDSQINVSWKETKGATEYRIYRDGVFLTTSKTPSLSDMGLKSATRYCYAVTAVGDDGQESVMSRTACDETFAPPKELKREAEAKALVLTQKEEKAAAQIAKELKEKGETRINILFDFDKANVKPKYHSELKKFAAVLLRDPTLNVVIEGHTDNIGGKEYNQKLSERRAQAVVKYLVEKFGVPAKQLSYKGYGMTKPIADNKTKEGRAKNRRVMAVVTYEIEKK